MLSLEQSSQILSLVQSSLIYWAQNLPYHTFPYYQKDINNLQDIISTNFLVNILSKVSRFKLCNTITLQEQQQQSNDDLGIRVNKIKNIGKSIIKFYQIEMLKDTSQLDFNYVQMCLGDKKEIIRFITAAVGIIIQDLKLKQELLEQLNTIPKNLRQIFIILIENSRKIGQQCNCSSRSKSSPKDKLFDRIQYLEQRIQSLTYILQKQQQQLIENKDLIINLTNKNKQLSNQLINISQEKQYMTDIIYKYQSKINCQNIIQETWSNKYQKLKNQFEKIVLLTNQQQSKIQVLNSKNHNNKQQQEKLITIKRQLQEKLKRQQSQFQISLKNVNKLREELIYQRNKILILERQKIDLTTSMELLKIQLQKIDKDQIIVFTQDNNINYQKKQNLQWLSNSGIQDFFIKQNRNIIDQNFLQTNRKNSQQKTISNKDNNNGSFNHYNENNNQNDNHNTSNNNINNNINRITNSQQQFRNIRDQYQRQINMLIHIIVDLYGTLKKQRRQNRQNQTNKKSRLERFQTKIKEIFR